MTPQTSAAGSFGIGVAGSVLSGASQIAAGKQEEKGYDYNASVDEVNASNAIVSVEQRYSQIVGKQAAAYSAAGVDITRGSPLLMMAATAGRGGRQSEEILQSSNQDAALQRYYGKLAAWRGTIGGVGSFLSGISTAAQSILKLLVINPVALVALANGAGPEGMYPGAKNV